MAEKMQHTREFKAASWTTGYMIESGFSSKNIKTQKICISRSAEYKFIWFSGDYLMLFMQFQLKSKQRLIHIVRYPSHSLTLFDSILKSSKWYSGILCNGFIAVVFSVLFCSVASCQFFFHFRFKQFFFVYQSCWEMAMMRQWYDIAYLSVWCVRWKRN